MAHEIIEHNSDIARLGLVASNRRSSSRGPLAGENRSHRLDHCGEWLA